MFEWAMKCATKLGSNHWMAGNRSCAPCYCSKNYPGPWKASLVAMWHPKKNWVRHWDSFLKKSHNHPGQGTWHGVGISHPLSYTAHGKIKWYIGLLKTTFRVIASRSLKHQDIHFTKATELVNTRGSASGAGPVQWNLLHTIEGE